MWLRGSMKILKRKGPKTEPCRTSMRVLFVSSQGLTQITEDEVSDLFQPLSQINPAWDITLIILHSPLSGNSWREFCIIKADQAGTDFKYANLRVLSLNSKRFTVVERQPGALYIQFTTAVPNPWRHHQDASAIHIPPGMYPSFLDENRRG